MDLLTLPTTWQGVVSKILNTVVAVVTYIRGNVTHSCVFVLGDKGKHTILCEGVVYIPEILYPQEKCMFDLLLVCL